MSMHSRRVSGPAEWEFARHAVNLRLRDFLPPKYGELLEARKARRGWIGASGQPYSAAKPWAAWLGHAAKRIRGKPGCS